MGRFAASDAVPARRRLVSVRGCWEACDVGVVCLGEHAGYTFGDGGDSLEPGRCGVGELVGEGGTMRQTPQRVSWKSLQVARFLKLSCRATWC